MTMSAHPAVCQQGSGCFTFCRWCLPQNSSSTPWQSLWCSLHHHQQQPQPWQEQPNLSLFSVQGVPSLPKEPLQSQLPRLGRAVPNPGENKPENGTLGKGRTLLIPNKAWLRLGLCQSQWSAALTRGIVATRTPLGCCKG